MTALPPNAIIARDLVGWTEIHQVNQALFGCPPGMDWRDKDGVIRPIPDYEHGDVDLLPLQKEHEIQLNLMFGLHKVWRALTEKYKTENSPNIYAYDEEPRAAIVACLLAIAERNERTGHEARLLFHRLRCALGRHEYTSKIDGIWRCFYCWKVLKR